MSTPPRRSTVFPSEPLGGRYYPPEGSREQQVLREEKELIRACVEICYMSLALGFPYLKKRGWIDANEFGTQPRGSFTRKANRRRVR
jgi:hypothetical protein